MTATIGVDIGGTSTRVALVGADAMVLACEGEATRSFAGYSSMLRWIVEVVGALSTAVGSRGGAMGLAVPGILNPSRTAVVRSVNVPLLEGREIAGHLAELTGRPVTLLTDADAATWGEWSAVVPSPRRFAHLRLGTGVACGVVVDRLLQPLEREPGRHVAVLVVERGVDAAKCSCGGAGCLEAFASGAALARGLSEQGLAPSLDLLRTTGDRAPEVLRSIRERCVTGVGTAIDSLVIRYGVEVVVLGGGVFEAIPELFDAIVDRPSHVRSSGIDPSKTPIRRAVLGDGAGVIGAALLVRAAPSSPFSPSISSHSG